MSETTSPDVAPIRAARLPMFAWRPTPLTWVALGSVLLMWAAYSGLAQLTEGIWSSIAFSIVVGVLISTLLPAMALRGHGGLSALGIGRHKLWWAMGISVVLALGSFYQAMTLANQAGAPLGTQLAANFMVFWEPLFLFGWLQLRFREAFGHIPAVLLVALSFGLYHVGAVSLATAAGFAMFGLFFALVFALIPNLLVVWPLTWAVSSTIGTLQSGFVFTWGDVVEAAIVLVVEFVVLYVVLGRRRATS